MTLVAERRAAGLCVKCGGTPVPGRKNCELCLKKQRAYDARKREQARTGVSYTRRWPEVVPWRRTKDSADDGRCGRCDARLPGDIEHGCPLAPGPVSLDVTEYLRSGDEASDGLSSQDVWGGRSR
jgi:hypothetical protein